MSGAVAIFVKTPGYSPVKTRLAASTGEAFAVEWHRRAAAAVAAAAEAASRPVEAALYWAVAEPAALGDAAWSDLPNLAQGTGGLGARMGRVHGTLVERHGAGILLGADTPQLDPAALRAALDWLSAGETARQTLGLAHDGGFWLYGGNRATPIATWESVAYSRSDTAARFQVAFADRGAWTLHPALTDVDEAADLPAMVDELAALANPVAAQRDLRVWLASAPVAGRVGRVSR